MTITEPARQRRRRALAIGLAAGLFAGLVGVGSVAYANGAICLGVSWVADVDLTAEGAPTPTEAIERWSNAPAAERGTRFPPPPGPWTTQERASGEIDASKGQWRLGLQQTERGGWLVSGAGCV